MSLFNDTGAGEDLSGRATPILWIAGVEVWALAFHDHSLFWSNDTGIHERPLDGDERAVLGGHRVVLFAVDTGAVFFIEDRGRAGFDLSVLREGKAAPQRLAHGNCNPRDMALTSKEVVVASLCEGLFAVPKQGGRQRSIVPYGENELSLATGPDRICYANGPHVTCQSATEPGTGAAARTIEVEQPGPLALDGEALFWQESAPGSDVVMGGEFGRIVRLDIVKGERQKLASMQYQAFELLQDEQALYFFSNRGGLRRVAKDGSHVQTLFHLGHWGSPFLAIGGGYAFWGGRPGKEGIHRLALPGK